MLDILHNM